MLARSPNFGEMAAPRYTSYPTAPHFSASIGANTYASWLDDLQRYETLSLYLHVPFCRNICLYCGCNTKAVRRSEPIDAYIEVLSREIGLVADRTGCRRIVHLHWGGGTPSILGPERLRKLVAQLDVRFDLSGLREHAFELDPRYVTKELSAVLADVGVTRVSLGVQDLSTHVQNAIGRVQPFSVVQRATDALREVNISDINIDLMYGLPNQSAHDIQRTVNLVHELKPQRLAVFGYAHVPWFKSHQRLLEESTLPSRAERLNHAKVADETLISLGYQPIGLDHYAVPTDSLAIAARTRVLRRNFQGYTTDDASALIGFGASAIGRLTRGYVQNVSDTPNYSRAISTGRLATVRGIALSIEDHVRSRIIEELMCHLDCDIGDLLDEYNGFENSFEHELEALRPFIADGFVRINGKRIIVEERGRRYLRVIASTFDAYLPNSQVRHSGAV